MTSPATSLRSKISFMGVIMLFKGYNSALTSSEMSLPDPVDTYVGGICFKSTLKNNRNIRFFFLMIMFPLLKRFQK